jgi:CYTH domain-containing protein
MENPSAPPGKSGKYARRELERRFLLAGPPPGDVVGTAEIRDRYIEGTRLRLRTMVERVGAGTRTFYKLTQKVPAPDGAPGLITTVYLTEGEHARFLALPALVLEKTRLSVPPFGVDVFAAPLAGLFLAEAEFESEGEMRAFAPPPWAVAEVTLDARFTGGRFVRMSHDELLELLRGFGI